MKYYYLLSLVIVLFCASCNNMDHGEHHHHAEHVVVEPTQETKEMAQRLKSLIDNGKPKDYFHWNTKQAETFKTKLQNQSDPEFMTHWYQYCSQMLLSGKSKSCIGEIESFIKSQNTTYTSLTTPSGLQILELLGIAYLRQGEQENCQMNHSEYSCRLPLKSSAIHTARTGSEKAIEIFSIIQKVKPNEKYKWLINLAHMTLGDYPDKVSPENLIPFPNWDAELKEFPEFREIASSLGLAVNGLSGGVCMDDFNNDGLLDIFATSYGMEDQAHYFVNNGAGGFQSKTNDSGMNGIVSGLNCIHADYDNDGDKDIYILRGAWLGANGNHPNSLLQNDGKGNFSDVTKSAGLLTHKPTQSAAWADINRDGHLDLFVGNESPKGLNNPCQLYINQGNGKFIEQSSYYGLGNIVTYVKGVSFGDINNDGYPDLFISVLGGKNLLYKNVKGSFVNISASAQIQEPLFSFPCWFWDINNDGYEDIFISGYEFTNLDNLAEDFAKELQNQEITTAKPRLYINNKDETFSDKTKEYNLDKTMYSMGANFGDLDNDGFLDFYVGTGAPDFTTVVPNRMFKNMGGNSFSEVTSAGLFGHIQKGHGVAFGDLDCDGDQDIYSVMGGAYEGDTFFNVLFENPIQKNNWVIIDLKGKETNRSAIGSKLKLTLDSGQTIFHSINTGGSFGSQSLQAELGLAKAKKIEELTVYWQKGKTQVFKDLEINKKYVIEEGASAPGEVEYKKLAFDMNSGGGHDHHHH